VVTNSGPIELDANQVFGRNGDPVRNHEEPGAVKTGQAASQRRSTPNIGPDRGKAPSYARHRECRAIGGDADG
jgi:hypothetical protein